MAPEEWARGRKEKKKWIHDSRGAPNMDRKNVQISMIQPFPKSEVPYLRTLNPQDLKFRRFQDSIIIGFQNFCTL